MSLSVKLATVAQNATCDMASEKYISIATVIPIAVHYVIISEYS